MEQQSATETRDEFPLSYARALSWVSLVLILCTGIGLSVVLSNAARERLLSKQTDFARLLAENLNHQIYRRFTLPTALAFGRIALRQPTQYERLNQVVLSVIHGWQLKSLRVYDLDIVIGYSLDKEEIGADEPDDSVAARVMESGAPEFEIISAVPFSQALFMGKLEVETFVLRATYPLRVEIPPGISTEEGSLPPMGVLEFSQDITGDFASVITFQRLIAGVIMFSSSVLFSLLLLFIRRADKALALRMARNRALEETLHTSERLAAMGRVVASIAHEIRNPLGIIRSSAEFLLKRENTKQDPRTHGILQAVYDEAVRLSRTVNDFLDYARPREPKRNATVLNRVAEQVTAFQAGEFERLGIRVESDMDEELVVRGDKNLLYRALYNLTANAVQAMNGPGLIRIRGRRREKGGAELTLTDSGPGFPEEHLSRLTDPFFTTKDDGIGLGLPIASSIITSHGGELILENAAEGGARARIILYE